jgi:hypothetical protein
MAPTRRRRRINVTFLLYFFCPLGMWVSWEVLIHLSLGGEQETHLSEPPPEEWPKEKRCICCFTY